MATSDNEWYNEWSRMTTSGTTNGKLYSEWQRVTMNFNKWQWQQMTMSDSDWQRVVQRTTTNGNEWQQMIVSDSVWQKVVQRVKTAHLLQKMDDCIFFYNENRYTTSSDGWLILDWLNRLLLTSSKKVTGLNK